ncbi:MAG: hypothetical protein ACJKSS_00800 [Patescibacteria group bacterium UBA2103]
MENRASPGGKTRSSQSVVALAAEVAPTDRMLVVRAGAGPPIFFKIDIEVLGSIAVPATTRAFLENDRVPLFFTFEAKPDGVSRSARIPEHIRMDGARLSERVTPTDTISVILVRTHLKRDRASDLNVPAADGRNAMGRILELSTHDVPAAGTTRKGRSGSYK